MSLRVTLLADNERGAAGLRSQWGFSAWVEADGARIVLDSGCNDAFWRNAQKLGVPLEKADVFVLSHGHFDHGGGIRRMVEAAPAARLVLHPGALAPHFWLCKTGKVEPIGLPDASLAALRSASERVTWALGPLEVAPRVWASGPIPRHDPLEKAERNFFLDRACTVGDQVVDEPGRRRLKPQAPWVMNPTLDQRNEPDRVLRRHLDEGINRVPPDAGVARVTDCPEAVGHRARRLGRDTNHVAGRRPERKHDAVVLLDRRRWGAE